MCSKPYPCQQAERGLTLIELLIFIVIIGVAATAILGVFGSLTRNSASLLPDKQAQAIAAGMMQEILARSAFCDPSDPPGETRATPFNNVDDYDGFDSDPVGISFLDGTPLDTDGDGNPDFPGYRAQVAVTNVGAGFGLPNNDALRINVIVTALNGATAQLDGVRFCYATTP